MRGQGAIATHPGTICRLCGHQIAQGAQIVPRHGSWIHLGCAPGGDE